MNRFPVVDTYLEPLGDLGNVGRFSVDYWGLINFRALNLKNEFGWGWGLGSFFGENSLVLSVPPRYLGLLALSLFPTNLSFDFRAYPRFQFGALANFRFSPEAVFFFCVQPCLGLSLPTGFLFSDQAG
jgi:hypothetical protein